MSFAARAFGNDALADELDRKKASLEAATPADEQNLATKLTGGAGSMAAFLGPGMGVGNTVARMGKVGRWLASLIAGSLEAAAEGGDAYTSAIRQGMTDADAKKAMWKVFVRNVPLNVLLDKVGVLNSEAGSSLKRILKAHGVEAAQEAAQTVIQNLALGRPWYEGVREDALIGGILGGGVKAVVQTGRALEAYDLHRQRALRDRMGPLPQMPGAAPGAGPSPQAQGTPSQAPSAPAPGTEAQQANQGPTQGPGTPLVAPKPQEVDSHIVAVAQQVEQFQGIAEQLTAKARQHPHVEQAQEEARAALELLEDARRDLASLAPNHPLLAAPEPVQAPAPVPVSIPETSPEAISTSSGNENTAQPVTGNPKTATFRFPDAGLGTMQSADGIDLSNHKIIARMTNPEDGVQWALVSDGTHHGWMQTNTTARPENYKQIQRNTFEDGAPVVEMPWDKDASATMTVKRLLTGKTESTAPVAPSQESITLSGGETNEANSRTGEARTLEPTPDGGPATVSGAGV
ncbi:MAG TPA: hypothetical protein PLC09_12525, partial [Holophaga sp.]|nr:hypothetical protein [Holophaga sp.]